jgi:hypothetical protein
MSDLLILIYFGAAAAVIGLILTIFSKKNELQNVIAFSILGGGLFILVVALFLEFVVERR